MLVMFEMSRALSGMRTRIGTCRSDSENLAAFWSISPMVAMRMAWLSVEVLTPRLAARSRRGDDHLGPAQIAADARGDHLGQALHLLDHCEAAVQLLGIGGGEHHLDRTRPKQNPD
jgi:hypothetical protein